MPKVIIDCDPGIDDALALLLALASPELDVAGITTVSGNVPADMGARNAKKVLRQADRQEVPVYIGEMTPLGGTYVDAMDTHGSDGLGESFLPEVAGRISGEDSCRVPGRGTGKGRDRHPCPGAADQSGAALSEAAGADRTGSQACLNGRQFQKPRQLFAGGGI